MIFMKNNSTYKAPILYKAFAILEEVASSQEELGISDLSRRLDISKSTVYGITNALTELGALRYNEEKKKYRLGPTLLQLGNQVIPGVDLRTIAKPFMTELSNEFKETIFIGTFSDKGITIIEKADSPQDLKISAPIGTRIPIFAGAAGKIFLAHAQEKLLQKVFAENKPTKYTENTITSRESYLKELEAVRGQGYATDFEEYIPGVNAISVPIFDQWGSIVSALWMVGFKHSFNGDKVNQAIDAATKAAVKIQDKIK